MERPRVSMPMNQNAAAPSKYQNASVAFGATKFDDPAMNASPAGPKASPNPRRHQCNRPAYGRGD
jgi:hypothetical protein